MYVTGGEGYYTLSGEQRARRGCFLILVQRKDVRVGPDNIRAIIRKVALRQLGPWMMGKARVLGETLTLSGSYGSDGLPVTVSDEIYAIGTDVPQELYDAWNNGGGHNSCGSEAEAMRTWALKLCKAGGPSVCSSCRVL